MEARRRLDRALVARGLAPSRERAQALIAAGLVRVAGQVAGSAAAPVAAGTEIAIAGRDHPWASRGGLKLAAALDHFGIACDARVCLDAGASSGGFTDVLLSRGARLVYAVDVGRGLLAPRLAGDPRVVVLDRTNVRSLTSLPGPAPDLATADLSFISLRLALPAVVGLLARPAEIVCLFKPQFELGRGAVPRGGVVRDQAAVEASLDSFTAWCRQELGAEPAGAVAAAVRGAKGNQEHVLHLRLAAEAAA